MRRVAALTGPAALKPLPTALAAQPLVAVGGNEGVVGQVRVGRKDAVDLLALVGLEALARVEAPRAGQEALPPEDLVDSGDAAGEGVGRVEDGGV